MRALSLTCVAVCAAFTLTFGVVAAAPADAKKKAKPPTVTVVKQVLSDHFAREDNVFGWVERLKFTAKIQIAKGRKSKPSVDLVRPGTTVFAVKTRFEVERQQDDGSWKAVSEVNPAKFLFHKDEFGDWTFTNQDVETRPLD
jgi:purine nucleoside permease